MKKVKIRRCLVVVAVIAVVVFVHTVLKTTMKTTVKTVNELNKVNTKCSFACSFAKIAEADPSHFPLPQGELSDELIMDYVKYSPAHIYGTYDSDVIEEYLGGLRQAGYQIKQFETKYEITFSQYDEASDSWFDGDEIMTDRAMVALTDGKVVYITPYGSAFDVHLFESRPTPEGGCSPKEAIGIIRTSIRRRDAAFVRSGSAGCREFSEQKIMAEPLDVTPAGMFEKTGAQVFVLFPEVTVPNVLPEPLYYIVRYGCAYEWTGRASAAFLDVTGDGNTELCLIEAAGLLKTENGIELYECFSVFPKPAKDGIPEEYTLVAGDSDFELGYWSVVHPWSGFEGTYDIHVVGMDQHRYDLTFSGGKLMLKGRDVQKTICSNESFSQ